MGGEKIVFLGPPNFHDGGYPTDTCHLDDKGYPAGAGQLIWFSTCSCCHGELDLGNEVREITNCIRPAYVLTHSGFLARLFVCLCCIRVLQLRDAHSMVFS